MAVVVVVAVAVADADAVDVADCMGRTDRTGSRTGWARPRTDSTSDTAAVAAVVDTVEVAANMAAVAVNMAAATANMAAAAANMGLVLALDTTDCTRTR